MRQLHSALAVLGAFALAEALHAASTLTMIDLEPSTGLSFDSPMVSKPR